MNDFKLNKISKQKLNEIIKQSYSNKVNSFNNSIMIKNNFKLNKISKEEIHRIANESYSKKYRNEKLNKIIKIANELYIKIKDKK